jgi:protein-S-isoprenylcysteine O-methyltransferase Ste14
MNYFWIAVAGLLFYTVVMISKLSFQTRVSRWWVALHILAALAAISTYLVMFRHLFMLDCFSPVGFALVPFGLILIVFAMVPLKSQAFMAKGKLVTKGVYRYLRNPLYAGILVACYGSVLFSLSRYTAAYALILTVVLSSVAKAEEKELSRRFGSRYDRYIGRVPAFIPRF